MSKARLIAVSISVLFLLAIAISCATVEKVEVKEEAEAEVEIKVWVQGIRGTVLLVDESGNEIQSLNKKRVLVNLVPVIDGKRVYQRSFSFSPGSDGTFFEELEIGEYTVELFLEGFYVHSLDIAVRKGETLELGEVRLKRIETDLGAPVVKNENQDAVMNGGDVNIEPPSY
jgi:hypothetical protein